MTATAVRLTVTEAAVAAHVGAARRLRALANGRRHRHGYDGRDNWTRHIEAAGAELVVAKVLDRYWTDTAEPDYDGDVAAEQVRHTTLPHGRLIVHESDPDGARYWLVTGEIPAYNVVGWIRGRDAKRAEWWTDPGTGRPAFFVPQSALVALNRPLPTGGHA